MKQDKIIKKSATFSKIINKKNKVKNNYFSIFYEESEKNLYGITIPKKIGKAHVRNKLKRQLKNIITINEKNIPNKFNYVIIIKETVLNLSYTDIEKEFLELIKKVGI